jgi:hypothetical protein
VAKEGSRSVGHELYPELSLVQDTWVLD